MLTSFSGIIKLLFSTVTSSDIQVSNLYPSFAIAVTVTFVPTTACNALPLATPPSVAVTVIL